MRVVSPAGAVSTLAGSGVAAYADGTGTAASFNNPLALAVDGAGSVYLLDGSNYRLRKITPGGVVSTLAGSGAAAFADGAGTAASFYTPTGIALGAAGNLYIADRDTERIRMYTAATGVMSTVAGIGIASYADGNGAEAGFNAPNAVAVDALGTVYIAELGTCLVRMLSPAGSVSTLAGYAGVCAYTDGAAISSRFNNPWGIAVDTAGNLYIADSGNHVIRKMTLTTPAS